MVKTQKAGRTLRAFTPIPSNTLPDFPLPFFSFGTNQLFLLLSLRLKWDEFCFQELRDITFLSCFLRLCTMDVLLCNDH